MYKVIGIDIAKQTFDFAFEDGKKKWHFNKVKNTESGFKKLEKWLDKNSLIVMEASGPYYFQLALYLYEKGYNVSVANPLVTRRFSQMFLHRAKTDKIDAKTLAQFGQLMHEKLKPWSPPEQAISQLRQMQTLMDGYKKELTMLRNRKEAFLAAGIMNPEVMESLERSIEHLKQEITLLEKKMEEISYEHYKENMELLQSIPGIGKKTAIALIVLTNNFKKFEHYKQLIAYVGMSPRIFESGESVKGKGHIAKMGNAYVRKLLYISAWSAKRWNKTANEMYERLKEKGKPERVIKVAIANKLLKQSFAIVKSGRPYDPNHEPTPFNTYQKAK